MNSARKPALLNPFLSASKVGPAAPFPEFTTILRGFNSSGFTKDSNFLRKPHAPSQNDHVVWYYEFPAQIPRQTLIF